MKKKLQVLSYKYKVSQETSTSNNMTIKWINWRKQTNFKKVQLSKAETGGNRKYEQTNCKY